MTKFKSFRKLSKGALLWAVGILLLVELALYLPAFWQLPAVVDTRAGSRVFEVAQQRSPNPKIALLGSSRLQNSVVPDVIEQRMAMNTGEVSNLSFSAATPQDYLRLYRTEREYFSNVDLLLVEVGEFHYNWSAIADEAAGNMRFRQIADFTDRLKTPSTSDKIDYALGRFVRVWDSRFVIRDLVVSMARGRFQLSEQPIQLFTNGQIGLSSANANAEFEPEQTNQLDAFGFKNFEISEYQLKAISSLLALAREDEVSVVLMSPPLNDGFQTLVADNYADDDRLWRTRVEQTTGQEIVGIEITDSRCADWQVCFYDYGHTNSTGAEGFSTALADYLSDLEY